MTWEEFKHWYDDYCGYYPGTPAWMQRAAQRAREAGATVTVQAIQEHWFAVCHERSLWAMREALHRLARNGALDARFPDHHIQEITRVAGEIERTEGVGTASDPRWDDYSCDICNGLGLVVIETPYPDGRPHESTVACICERGSRVPIRGMRRLRDGDVLASSGGRKFRQSEHEGR